MHSQLLLLALSASTVIAAPSALLSSDLSRREDGGFSLPAYKRENPHLLRKRAGSVMIGNRWWVTMGIGTPPQDLNFLPDSGANDFSMSSTLEPKSTQGDELLYDPSKSSTAKQMAGYTYSEGFVSGYSDSGVVYTDTIKVGSQVFSSVPICVETASSTAVYGDRTGNLGIDPDTGGQSTSPNRVPTFMQSVRSSLSKGVIALSYNSYTKTGTMDVGFVDTNKYTGAITYVPNQSGSTLWSVHFDGMVINGKVVNTPFQATVDSGTGGANIPRAALDAYFANITGATFSSSYNSYTFPCNANLPDMTFSVGLLPLRIPKYSWLGPPTTGGGNTCPCLITASDTATDAFLGEVFIEGAYVVFDFDNTKLGFANKPAFSTTVPTAPVAGTVKFCTGTGFTGNCVDAQWLSNTCGGLSGTQFYHNIGSFNPSIGGCTLYSDNYCGSPLPYATNIHAPGISNTYGSGPAASSYMCENPTDYNPTPGSGFLQFCTDVNFAGTCQTFNYQSYACQNLTSTYKNNVKSAGPNKGYCYLYTSPSCSNSVEDGAPLVYPGFYRLEYGNKLQSFMCI